MTITAVGLYCINSIRMILKLKETNSKYEPNDKYF
jgi:hypothetical protein